MTCLECGDLCLRGYLLRLFFSENSGGFDQSPANTQHNTLRRAGKVQSILLAILAGVMLLWSVHETLVRIVGR